MERTCGLARKRIAEDVVVRFVVVFFQGETFFGGGYSERCHCQARRGVSTKGQFQQGKGRGVGCVVVGQVPTSAAQDGRSEQLPTIEGALHRGVGIPPPLRAILSRNEGHIGIPVRIIVEQQQQRQGDGGKAAFFLGRRYSCQISHGGVPHGERTVRGCDRIASRHCGRGCGGTTVDFHGSDGAPRQGPVVHRSIQGGGIRGNVARGNGIRRG
mmetsp:Transcript_15471/g.32770  ORF Transcript_15471/g.32770 Transcript_15471/m.32770 type:complete len:213 (+) Transcript_15471:417-1055(+)